MRTLPLIGLLVLVAGCNVFSNPNCPKSTNLKMTQAMTLADSKPITVCIDVSNGQAVDQKCCVDVNVPGSPTP